MASKYSSIDNSPSKQKYSFPKAERFPKISIYGAMSFYNLPSVRTKRSTTLGYGSRYNFVPKDAENTPACYNYRYGVESKQPYSPKYSFGLGRENIKDNFQDKSIPGPGKYYSPLKSIGKEGPKYSMKGKYYNSLYGSVDSPGPAAYDPHTKMTSKGVFGIAGYKNVQSYDFSKGGDRFKYKADKTPGPSEYKNNKSMFGNIYDSRYKSTQGIQMTFKHEIKDSKENYPGPGAYERYGDFYKYNDRFWDSNKKKSKKDGNKTPEKKKENNENENENEDKQGQDEAQKNDEY